MKKLNKLVALLLCFVVTIAFVGCSSGSSSDGEEPSASTGSEDAKTHIYILTPTEDHGWTGSVATFAKATADEINQAGVYTAEVITSANPNEQISQIEDIVANYKGDGKVAVTILPQDDTLESAIQQLVDAGIPYTAFDRIIDGVSASAVANVKGDNAGIGSATAEYFVSLGMNPGEKVYVYEGDTSSVTALRDSGFTDYLLGNAEYDGKTISDDKKWTQEQIDQNVVFTGAMNWSRSTAKEHFESLMSDASNADIKWIYAEDDELSVGIFEALNGSGIDDNIKSTFLANKPVITGAGGLKEFYDVIDGSLYADLSEQMSGVMSATYNPSMIQIAINLLVDSLDGKTVEQDCIVPVSIVTKDNVAEFEPFN